VGYHIKIEENCSSTWVVRTTEDDGHGTVRKRSLGTSPLVAGDPYVVVHAGATICSL
jgi:hypothetical protein